ncbi:unnamed protein product [Rhodiola kirilowii]
MLNVQRNVCLLAGFSPTGPQFTSHSGFSIVASVPTKPKDDAYDVLVVAVASFGLRSIG